MWRALIVLTVAAFCTLLSVASAQTKKTESSLEGVFADWKERQAILRTARYVISGTIEYKDEKLPPGDPVRPKRFEVLLDLERKRFRLESSTEAITEDGAGNRSYIPRVSTQTYDGQAVQTLTHRDVNRIPIGPDLGISKGDLVFFRVDSELSPVFIAHGIVPTVHGELRPDKMPTTHNPEDFDVRGNLPFKGRKCLVLRTEAAPFAQPSFDEFWVDRGRMSAILRHVTFVGSDPAVRTDVEWKRKDIGWWPDSWSQTWNRGPKVWRITRLRVESFEPNPAISDSDFTLQVKPGMEVSVSEYPPAGSGLNPGYPANRTFHVTESGGWEEISAKGFTTLDGKVLPHARSSIWFWAAAAATAALILAAIGYVVHRRKAGLTR
jgi:hypothetical protein